MIGEKEAVAISSEEAVSQEKEEGQEETDPSTEPDPAKEGEAPLPKGTVLFADVP